MTDKIFINDIDENGNKTLWENVNKNLLISTTVFDKGVVTRVFNFKTKNASINANYFKEDEHNPSLAIKFSDICEDVIEKAFEIKNKFSLM